MDNATNNTNANFFPPPYPAYPEILYLCIVEEESGCRTTPVCGVTNPRNCDVPACPDDYAGGGLANSEPALSGNLDVETDYEAEGAIKSTQIIGSNTATIVDYDSATEICLDPGFEVVGGTIFSAFIDGCNGGLGGEIEPPAITTPETDAVRKVVEQELSLIHI